MAALEARPLGPNLAAFIGHSDMRTAVMGLDRATRKDERPNRREQAEMERMLAEALDAGFVGMSSMQLLFDKLDGDVCRSRTLPSTYAKPPELRRLKGLLRKAGRVLQSGPDIKNPLNLGSQIAQFCGVFRNPLKTSLLSARLLRHVRDAEPSGAPFMTVERAAHRLTGEFADWYRLDAGHLRIGDRADVVIVDPACLDARPTVMPKSRSPSTADCRGWSPATTRRCGRCSSAAVRCSSTASPPSWLAPNGPASSPAPTSPSPLFRRRGTSCQVSVEDLDVPVGPTAAAKGPEDIVKRLNIGLAPLSSYENFTGLLVTDGSDAIYEHHEEWH